MPFVTEELWQRLPKAPWQQDIPSIMVAPYPRADSSWADSAADSSMEDALAVVKAARSMRRGRRPCLADACFLSPTKHQAIHLLPAGLR